MTIFALEEERLAAAFEAIRRQQSHSTAPDDQRASKVAVGIINEEGAEPAAMQRWFSEDSDVRDDPAIASEILEFVRDRGARSIAMADRIIGCPHEEGDRLPEGKVCPQCPFWAHRDRWSGELIQ